MFLFLLALNIFHVYGNVDINEKMRSFSHAIKSAACQAGQEITLYEHKTGPGVLTEQRFRGYRCFHKRTIVRYYIDCDTTPSIEANLFMMHGIGFDDKNMGRWDTKWIGHLASGGGLYNKYRIPFQHSIRITFISPTNGYYWFIARGVENYPIIIGDLQLPSNARLVLHKVEDKTLQPLVYVPLVVTEKSGIVFSVTLRGESKNMMYLEGCFGTVVTVGNKNITNFLSSGTEDMFLSAYYYNKGVFHTDDSGLTYFRYPGKMSAYKFFAADPVMIEGKFSLLWRVSEKYTTYANCWLDLDAEQKQDKDISDYLTFQPGSENSVPFPAKISSYVWTYEW